MKYSVPSEQFDQYDADEPHHRARPGGPKRAAPKKTSYESNADVQRWVKEQTDEHEGEEPSFDPAFLASRRDGFWILSSLKIFFQQGLITDVLSEVSSGKEATVFRCAAHPSTGATFLAAKVYRPRMFRSLRNDAIYRESRATRNAEGRVERRGQRAATKTSERGRALQVASWIQHEYLTQRSLHAAGASVPRPLAQIGNAIVMDYIGDEQGPALRLSDITPPAAEAQALFDHLLQQIALFLAHDCIHGDLSAYNILYRRGQVTVIDFAQAVDPRYNPNVLPLLERDIDRVCRYVARYGIRADAPALAAEMWRGYQRGEQ